MGQYEIQVWEKFRSVIPRIEWTNCRSGPGLRPQQVSHFNIKSPEEFGQWVYLTFTVQSLQTHVFALAACMKNYKWPMFHTNFMRSSCSVTCTAVFQEKDDWSFRRVSSQKQKHRVSSSNMVGEGFTNRVIRFAVRPFVEKVAGGVSACPLGTLDMFGAWLVSLVVDYGQVGNFDWRHQDFSK